MAPDTTAVVLYNVVYIVLFGLLGTFILYRSMQRRVFNISWMGGVFATYGVYYFLIFLNTIGVISGAFGFLLEGVFFAIMIQGVLFIKSTFFVHRAKRRFMIFIVLVLGIGTISSTLAVLGDIRLPYNAIFDIFDVWRYFLDDVIVGLLVFLIVLVASVRAYLRSGKSMSEVRWRLKFFSASSLGIEMLWILNFIGAFLGGLAYDIFNFAQVVTMVTLYLGWLVPGRSIQHAFDLPLPSGQAIPPSAAYTKAYTSHEVYLLIDHLGDKLASLINQTPGGCKGLLLLSIQAQLGEESLSKLDLRELPAVFNGSLRARLNALNAGLVDDVIHSLESYLVDNFDLFSIALY
jgi:hypothetical protein